MSAPEASEGRRSRRRRPPPPDISPGAGRPPGAGGHRRRPRPAPAAARGEPRGRGAGEEAARGPRLIDKGKGSPSATAAGESRGTPTRAAAGAGWAFLRLPVPGRLGAHPSRSPRALLLHPLRGGEGTKEPLRPLHTGISCSRRLRSGQLLPTPPAPSRAFPQRCGEGRGRDRGKTPPAVIGRSDAVHFTFGSLTPHRAKPAGPGAPRPRPGPRGRGPRRLGRARLPSRDLPPRVPRAGRTLGRSPEALRRLGGGGGGAASQPRDAGLQLPHLRRGPRSSARRRGQRGDPPRGRLPGRGRGARPLSAPLSPASPSPPPPGRNASIGAKQTFCCH